MAVVATASDSDVHAVAVELQAASVTNVVGNGRAFEQLHTKYEKCSGCQAWSACESSECWHVQSVAEEYATEFPNHTVVMLSLYKLFPVEDLPASFSWQ